MSQIELTKKECRYLWAAMTIADAVTDGDAKFNEGLMLLLRDHFKEDLETIDKAFEILTTDYLWTEPEGDPPIVTVEDKLGVQYRHDPRFGVTFDGDDRWM